MIQVGIHIFYNLIIYLFFLIIIKGNKIGIGEEKDIGEFNLNFLERIEEGLYYCDSLENISSNYDSTFKK